MLFKKIFRNFNISINSGNFIIRQMANPKKSVKKGSLDDQAQDKEMNDENFDDTTETKKKFDDDDDDDFDLPLDDLDTFDDFDDEDDNY